VPVLLAALEAFVIAIAVNIVVFIINGIRSMCRREEEGNQRSRGRRGSHEIQDTSSGRQRRIIEGQKIPPLPGHLIEKCWELIKKHADYKAARRAEAEAAQSNPSFMLEPTKSAQRDLELGY